MVGLSVLSGAHMTIFPRVISLLKQKRARDIMVIGGGIIPQHDMKKLEKKGVRKLFGPGTPTTEIIDWIHHNIGDKTTKMKTMHMKKRKRMKRRKKR